MVPFQSSPLEGLHIPTKPDSDTHAAYTRKKWRDIPDHNGVVMNTKGTYLCDMSSLLGLCYNENYYSTHKNWRRKWHPTPVSLPGESHGQRSLVGYRPWGRVDWIGYDWATSLSLSLFSRINTMYRKLVSWTYRNDDWENIMQMRE